MKQKGLLSKAGELQLAQEKLQRLSKSNGFDREFLVSFLEHSGQGAIDLRAGKWKGKD